MRFIGRTEELKKLNKEIGSSRMSFCLIYGRRRVGKSELAKAALAQSDVTSIYYECRQTSEQGNVESLCDVISESLNLPKLGYRTIEETFRFLFDSAEKRKLTVVIDEYPYLRETVKGLDSVLQVLIDTYRERSNLTLMILGSYVEVMKSLLDAFCGAHRSLMRFAAVALRNKTAAAKCACCGVILLVQSPRCNV